MNARSSRGAALAAIFALGASASAQAGALEDGSAAYHAGEYAKAAEIWKPLADSGVAAAQQHIGVMYAEGKGFPQNDVEAAKWFAKAAEGGDALAQYDLGASFAQGLGVKQDYELAAKWFRRAAMQGMAIAQLNLGLLYASGNGVPKDPVEAMKWVDLSVYGLPAGGVRSDAARALGDLSSGMTSDQILEAKSRERGFKATPEAK
jgi:TPR repeat protein